MQFYSESDIESSLTFPALIEALRTAFAEPCEVPARMHVSYHAGQEGQNTLLLMPAVQQGVSGGVKLVTLAPGNSKKNLASIQGIYYLFDPDTGVPKAFFDAKSLTNWRTAAASALAADYLSKKDAECHFMIGTGALAPYVIRAHASIRPIRKLRIYGRTREKAESLAAEFIDTYEEVRVVSDVEEGMKEADIISAATLTDTPLIRGEWLRPGQHIDLIGSFKPDQREADDEVMRRTEKYVDTEMAMKEAGDLSIPLANNLFDNSEIRGDLPGLCSGTLSGRSTSEEITLFKSVGYALEDLVAAELVHKNKDQ